MTLLPSDPLYAEWDYILTVRAQWINTACHYDLATVAEAERAAMVAGLTEDMRAAFEELSR